MVELRCWPLVPTQVCEFIEEEEAHLRAELLAQGTYNEATATVGERRCCRCRSPALCLLLGRDRLADLGGVACRGGQGPPPCRASIKACRFLGTSLVPAEAKGVVASRLQNVVITLDKVKMVLRAPGQVRGHTAGECSGMHRLARLCALARRALAMRSEALPVAAANQPLLLWGEGGGGGRGTRPRTHRPRGAPTPPSRISHARWRFRRAAPARHLPPRGRDR